MKLDGKLFDYYTERGEFRDARWKVSEGELENEKGKGKQERKLIHGKGGGKRRETKRKSCNPTRLSTDLPCL